MAQNKVNRTDATQYGSAWNGMPGVGSGFDCEIRRESINTCLVNVMEPGADTDWLGVLDIDHDEDVDLQEMAVRIAGCPGDLDHVSADDDGWDELVARWNAIEAQ